MKLRLISEGEHKDAFGTHKWKTYAQIPTNADLIRSADTEIEMAGIILKLVKKIPEGESKRRTLYQLLMKEADDG